MCYCIVTQQAEQVWEIMIISEVNVSLHAGRYLELDLSTGAQRECRIAEEDARRFYLGSGYAAWLLAQELHPELDALDPQSPLYVFNGLLTGSLAPTACRTSFCGRCPLTGIWNEANVGGHFGAALRAAGFDGLVLRGRAAEPVYLYVHEGRVEVRPAGHLWGLDTFEAYARLMEETHPKARAAVIGPAGEQGVRYAAIMQGGQPHSRAAGRGGMGAVFGSKQVKAIVAYGDEKPTYADTEAFLAHVKALNATLRQNGSGLAMYGTAGGVPAAEFKGDLPLRNWRDGSWPAGAHAISGQTLHETYWLKHTFCHACPIGCGKLIEVKEGPYAGVYGEGPEYETLAGFGGMLLIDDLSAISRCNDLCNRLGLDTISTSAAIAFAFEAAERGLLPAQVDGIPLTWGNAPAALHLITLIARREGLGALLADGVRAAAQQLGAEAARFALQVKGMEVAYHDPRAFFSMAVNYATANRGACHLEALSYWTMYSQQVAELYGEPYERFSVEGGGRHAAFFQDYMAVFNPLGLCKFSARSGLTPQDVAQLLRLALGWETTAEDVLRTGERLFNLKRLINLRYGITRADDTLPERFLKEPRPDGGAAGQLPDLDAMLAEYYAARGWDAQGRPTPQRLRELGLEGV